MVDQSGLARSGKLCFVQFDEDLREGARIVPSSMSLTTVDTELLGEIGELATGPVQIARQRQCIVRAQVEGLTARVAHSPHDCEIVLVTVVGDYHVISAECAEFRPHSRER